jgi:hypothetical protein
MNESINLDNVNPHFTSPESFGLTPRATTVPLAPMLGAQPCPTCGHCPT